MNRLVPSKSFTKWRSALALTAAAALATTTLAACAGSGRMHGVPHFWDSDVKDDAPSTYGDFEDPIPVSIVEDMCAAPDPAVHEYAVTTTLPLFGSVVSADEVIGSRS